MAQGLPGYPPPTQRLNAPVKPTSCGCVVAAACKCTARTRPSWISTRGEDSVLRCLFYTCLKEGISMRGGKQASGELEMLDSPRTVPDGLLSPRTLHAAGKGRCQLTCSAAWLRAAPASTEQRVSAAWLRWLARRF